MKNMEKTQVE